MTVLTVGLLLLPLAHVVALVLLFAYDVPVSDDWEVIPLLQKLAAHTLTWQDLWAPFAEHRIPFGRIAMLSQAWLTHWNLPVQCLVNVIMCAALMVPIGILLRNLARENREPRLSPFLLVASAWLVLSTNGWIDYFWAWQITLLLSILAFVTGITLLSPLTFTRAGAAIFCGIIATGSYGNGILFWFLAPLIILSARPLDLRRVGAAAGVCWRRDRRHRHHPEWRRRSGWSQGRDPAALRTLDVVCFELPGNPNRTTDSFPRGSRRSDRRSHARRARTFSLSTTNSGTGANFRAGSIRCFERRRGGDRANAARLHSRQRCPLLSHRNDAVDRESRAAPAGLETSSTPNQSGVACGGRAFRDPPVFSRPLRTAVAEHPGLYPRPKGGRRSSSFRRE